MAWYQWMAIASLLFCAAFLLRHFIRLLQKGNVIEYSVPAGNPGAGIRYSFTKAMSPSHKESAYLHLPTYTAGLLYHTGTFLTFALFFVFLFCPEISSLVSVVLAIVLAVTGVSGMAILVKRAFTTKLRNLSNPDDYLSNLLVTFFQLTALAGLVYTPALPWFFVAASILFLYIPAGKLKHLLYFFAARYHLGFFFGWRGSWPSRNQ